MKSALLLSSIFWYQTIRGFLLMGMVDGVLMRCFASRMDTVNYHKSMTLCLQMFSFLACYSFSCIVLNLIVLFSKFSRYSYWLFRHLQVVDKFSKTLTSQTSKMNFTNNRLTNLRIIHFWKVQWLYGKKSCDYVGVTNSKIFHHHLCKRLWTLQVSTE